jgi:hypothetical protein
MMAIKGDAPAYWLDEPAGGLGVAIRRYLRDETLSVRDVALFRAYLRQWIVSPVWDRMNGEETAATVARLRTSVDGLASAAAIRGWIAIATQWGLDPL